MPKRKLITIEQLQSISVIEEINDFISLYDYLETVYISIDEQINKKISIQWINMFYKAIQDYIPPNNLKIFSKLLSGFIEALLCSPFSPFYNELKCTYNKIDKQTIQQTIEYLKSVLSTMTIKNANSKKAKVVKNKKLFEFYNNDLTMLKHTKSNFHYKQKLINILNVNVNNIQSIKQQLKKKEISKDEKIIKLYNKKIASSIVHYWQVCNTFYINEVRKNARYLTDEIRKKKEKQWLKKAINYTNALWSKINIKEQHRQDIIADREMEKEEETEDGDNEDDPALLRELVYKENIEELKSKLEEQQKREELTIKRNRNRKRIKRQLEKLSKSIDKNRVVTKSTNPEFKLNYNNNKVNDDDDYLYKTNVYSPLFKAKLRSYQIEGVEWLIRIHDIGISGILGDEMGLGKTVQTIALIAYLASERGIWGPHLIIVPSSLIYNWQQEINKFAPGLSVIVYDGSKKLREHKRKGLFKKFNYCIIITSYNIAVADSNYLRRITYYYIIIDEAHVIRNYATNRWISVLSFNCLHRLLLTGTPLQNNLLELWSLMYIIVPELFGNHTNFNNVFNNPVLNAIKYNTANEHVLITIKQLYNIIKPFFIRRLKIFVENQLPRKTEHVIKCSLTRKQLQIYHDIIYYYDKNMREQKLKANVLTNMTLLMNLKKVCSHPQLIELNVYESPIDIFELQVKATISPLFVLARNMEKDIVYNTYKEIPKILYLPNQYGIIKSSCLVDDDNNRSFSINISNSARDKLKKRLLIEFENKLYDSEIQFIKNCDHMAYLNSKMNSVAMDETEQNNSKIDSLYIADLNANQTNYLTKFVKTDNKLYQEAFLNALIIDTNLDMLRPKEKKVFTKNLSKRLEIMLVSNKYYLLNNNRENANQSIKFINGLLTEQIIKNLSSSKQICLLKNCYNIQNIILSKLAKFEENFSLLRNTYRNIFHKISLTKLSFSSANVQVGSNCVNNRILPNKVHIFTQRITRAIEQITNSSVTFSQMKLGKQDKRYGGIKEQALKYQIGRTSGFLLNTNIARKLQLSDILLNNFIDSYINTKFEILHTKIGLIWERNADIEQLLNLRSTRFNQLNYYLLSNSYKSCIYNRSVYNEISSFNGIELYNKDIGLWINSGLIIKPDPKYLEFESGKLLKLKEVVFDSVSKLLKLVIFCQLNKMLDLIELFLSNYGIKYIRMDGETKIHLRQNLINKFNLDDKIRVFLTSARTGGIGINLTSASRIVFYDTDWNPAVDKQAMDRCHRIGQTRNVDIYRLICENTIEENIWRKQLEKRKLDDIILNSENCNQNEMTVFKFKDTAQILFSLTNQDDLYATRELHENLSENQQLDYYSNYYENSANSIEDKKNQYNTSIENLNNHINNNKSEASIELEFTDELLQEQCINLSNTNNINELYKNNITFLKKTSWNKQVDNIYRSINI